MTQGVDSKRFLLPQETTTRCLPQGPRQVVRTPSSGKTSSTGWVVHFGLRSDERDGQWNMRPEHPQTGYWTKYTYNALNQILSVTQNAQAAAASQQTRSFTYDLLGRMTSETNPENGLTTYTYDTDPTCGSSNGDLVKKVDAAGNVTCIAYDLLHRPTQISYPSGPYSATTPTKHFVYDAPLDGVAVVQYQGTTCRGLHRASRAKSRMSHSATRLGERLRTCTR